MCNGLRIHTLSSVFEAFFKWNFSAFKISVYSPGSVIFFPRRSIIKLPQGHFNRLYLVVLTHRVYTVYESPCVSLLRHPVKKRNVTVRHLYQAESDLTLQRIYTSSLSPRDGWHMYRCCTDTPSTLDTCKTLLFSLKVSYSI